MSLHQKIREEIKTAMKQKEADRLRTVRSLTAELTNELIRQGLKPQDELKDQEVLKVVARLVKQRKDSIESYRKGGREDLIPEEQTELDILTTYLPQPLNSEELLDLVNSKKTELGLDDPKDKGRLIGAVLKETAGRADGDSVKEIVDSIFD